MNSLKKYFITGLIVIVPVFATFYVLWAVFKFLDNITGGILQNYLPVYVPGVGFLLSLLFILAVGAFASRFLRNRIFKGFEHWFSRLPLIKHIYPALKQVVLFLSEQKQIGFQKVVMVEYPSKGIWAVGFLTNEKVDEVNRAVADDMAAVFIPSTPGPLSGFTIFVQKKTLKFPDISVETALNLIISGGVYSDKNQLS